jgi:hypothetical protein
MRVEILEKKLDERQKKAADSILENPIQDDGFLLPIVDGPPGTGKTTVGAYACTRGILERIFRGVIYVAPTNFAAQQAKEAFEKLGVAPKDAIWLHHSVKIKDWDKGSVGIPWDLGDLSPNDIRRLRSVPIIICTPYMLGRIKRGALRSSDIKVVIDEFSQVDPALFFMILSRTGANVDKYTKKGYALLGDPLQLPVVTTQEELLENVVEFLTSYRSIDGGLATLTVQRRMHEEICNAVNRMRRKLSPWSNFALLEPSDDVKYRDLERLGYKYMEEKVPKSSRLSSEALKKILDPSYTFVVINSDKLPGAKDEEKTRSGSILNIAEAEATVDIAVAAYKSYQGPNGPLIPTIISPYNAQVSEILKIFEERHPDCRSSFKDHVITAYRSQGREYPMVIVSLVRKNPRRHIGFLEDEKLRAQVYVACSRAKAKLIVLMSKDTFGGKPLYEELVNVKGSRHALIWEWD